MTRYREGAPVLLYVVVDQINGDVIAASEKRAAAWKACREYANAGDAIVFTYNLLNKSRGEPPADRQQT